MDFSLSLTQRPRRNRKSPAIQALTRETSLMVEDLISPLFIHDLEEDQQIDSMPGCMRWSLEGLLQEAQKIHDLGIPAIALFPSISESLKTRNAKECFNPKGLVPRAVQLLKEHIPSLTIITDVALDPYNSDGHDGLVGSDRFGSPYVLNDETVEVLAKQALAHAEAGADIIAPSDMMDGRIGFIRKELDHNGFEKVSLMSYTAKYASAFYGPFRGALDSAPQEGDKTQYQMDPANVKEALRELKEDENEGADLVMVKPAGSYLDVISALSRHTVLPVAAYQVSGEYLMIKAASQSGWINEKQAIKESLLSIKRAGASMILSYFSKDMAHILSS